jgi:uncharacterized protein (DUF2236 family)
VSTRRNSPARPDPGLFGPDSITWQVHGDPAMLLAGLRALLLQAVHPLAMAGFDANTAMRADPWGRLRRTGEWVATVTYGTTQEAERAGRRLRAVHGRLAPGVDPETSRAYRVDDPALLLWVHCTEVESFLSTYRRSGGSLSPADGDRYVAEMVTSARLVGLDLHDVPRTEAEIHAYYDRVRPQLRVTPVARRNVLFGLTPPMPLWVAAITPARPLWATLVATSAGLLPPWARRLYGLPGLSPTDAAATLAARGVRSAIGALPDRWVGSPARRAAMERVVA